MAQQSPASEVKAPTLAVTLTSPIGTETSGYFRSEDLELSGHDPYNS